MYRFFHVLPVFTVYPGIQGYPGPGTFVAAANATMTPMSAPSTPAAPAIPYTYSVGKSFQLRPGELSPAEFWRSRPRYSPTPTPTPWFQILPSPSDLWKFLNPPPPTYRSVPGAVKG